MPGLLRGVARTAVVAGTATAVSNRVSRRQQGRWASQEEQQMATMQEPAPSPSDDTDTKLAQLKTLAELKAQGILSDSEFQQQKAAILNT